MPASAAPHTMHTDSDKTPSPPATSSRLLSPSAATTAAGALGADVAGISNASLSGSGPSPPNTRAPPPPRIAGPVSTQSLVSSKRSVGGRESGTARTAAARAGDAGDSAGEGSCGAVATAPPSAAPPRCNDAASGLTSTDTHVSTAAAAGDAAAGRRSDSERRMARVFLQSHGRGIHAVAVHRRVRACECWRDVHVQSNVTEVATEEDFDKLLADAGDKLVVVSASLSGRRAVPLCSSCCCCCYRGHCACHADVGCMLTLDVVLMAPR
jgi:hypothetical protein